jgi:hypothetical protein
VLYQLSYLALAVGQCSRAPSRRWCGCYFIAKSAVSPLALDPLEEDDNVSTLAATLRGEGLLERYFGSVGTSSAQK